MLRDQILPLAQHLLVRSLRTRNPPRQTRVARKPLPCSCWRSLLRRRGTPERGGQLLWVQKEEGQRKEGEHDEHVAKIALKDVQHHGRKGKELRRRPSSASGRHRAQPQTGAWVAISGRALSVADWTICVFELDERCYEVVSLGVSGIRESKEEMKRC